MSHIDRSLPQSIEYQENEYLLRPLARGNLEEFKRAVSARGDVFLRLKDGLIRYASSHYASHPGQTSAIILHLILDRGLEAKADIVEGYALAPVGQGRLAQYQSTLEQLALAATQFKFQVMVDQKGHAGKDYLEARERMISPACIGIGNIVDRLKRNSDPARTTESVLKPNELHPDFIAAALDGRLKDFARRYHDPALDKEAEKEGLKQGKPPEIRHFSYLIQVLDNIPQSLLNNLDAISKQTETGLGA